jgi:hypothetical protein
MRVALCLSGQPRFIERAFPSISEHLIKPNNADVFFHAWYHQDLLGQRFVTNKNGIPEDDLGSTYSKEIRESLLDLYKPKHHFFENQLAIRDPLIDVSRILNTHAKTYTRDEFVRMIYSSWYSIQKSNLAKEIYRLKNDISYDFVIRARFDSTLNLPVPCAGLTKHSLYVDNRQLPENMIPDWFAVSSNEISNMYSAGYNLIEYLAHTAGPSDLFCGENIVYRIMKAFQVPVIRFNDLIHLPVRRSA